MALTIWCTYEDGVLKPDEPLDLPDGTRVRLCIMPADADTLFPPWERIKLDLEDARAIVEDPEFSLLGGHLDDDEPEA